MVKVMYEGDDEAHIFLESPSFYWLRDTETNRLMCVQLGGGS